MAFKIPRLLFSGCKNARNFLGVRNVSSGIPGTSLAPPPPGFFMNAPENVTKGHPLTLMGRTVFPLDSPVFNNPGSKVPLGLPVNYNPTIGQITPTIGHIKPFLPMQDPSISSKIIEEAPEISQNIIEKQAARLIVIRRIKMNKHKLKKLRKRQRQEIAKRVLRRNIRKERAFLDERLAQIRQAERFDAKEYVASIIAKAKEKKIPRRINGKRMPLWYMKQQIALGKIKFEN